MSDFEPVTRALEALILRAAPKMSVVRQGPQGLSLTSRWCSPLKPNEPMWFGGVRQGKGYVSYHLMPVYTHPELAAKIGPALKKRMQGKSCFSFKAVDEALFEELEALTREGAALYSGD